MLSLSIVVFTYNSQDNIQDCLDSILEVLFNFSGNYEIFIIDNNSTDLTLIKLKSYDFVKVYTNPKQGLAYSRLFASKIISNDYVILVDDDLRLNHIWFKKIKSLLENKSYDVIGSRIEGVFDDNIFPEFWGKVQSAYACGSQYSISKELTQYNELLWGAGLVVKTSFYKKAYDFAEVYLIGRVGEIQMAGDDSELCYRLKILGAKFYYDDSVYLVHKMRDSRKFIENYYKTIKGFQISSFYLESYKYYYSKFFAFIIPIKAIIFWVRNPLNKVSYRRLSTIGTRILRVYKLKRFFR